MSDAMQSEHSGESQLVVNDIHSASNPTRAAEIVEAESIATVIETVTRAANDGIAVSICGGRHAMGAQQFGTNARLLDMSPMNRVLAFDQDRGRVHVEAGIQWHALIDHYLAEQDEIGPTWGIRQKQTGADRLSIGGSVAANIHGRGLGMGPFIEDIVSLQVVDANGRVLRCSREENATLFTLIIGGYGLFGVVISVEIQLVKRRKVRRVVVPMTTDKLMPAFDERIREDCLYGDFQFQIDPDSPGFLAEGVFSCYRVVGDEVPITESPIRLTQEMWDELTFLAHTDKSRAYEEFLEFYLSSSGQVYWSDIHQLSYYLDAYHDGVDARMGSTTRASEIITELYVPRESLGAFLSHAASCLREHGADVIYGTVRLIERDSESFLAWAREPYACVIFNLHTVHTKAGFGKTREDTRRLIDLAIRFGGSFFLTYQRYATAMQILACYPQFPEFLDLKQHYDPRGVFQSDWYRHYRDLLGSGHGLD